MPPPSFLDGPADPDNPNDWPGAPRSVAENSAAGASVGSPVTAADPDGDPLTYSMSASDVFDIDTDTGQIRVAAGATLDYEDTQSYTVTVGVSDGKDPDGNADTTVDDTIEITINVTDVDEPPAAPGAPDLTEPSGDKETSLDVAWTAPDMTGKPSITGYDVQYRVEGATDWTDASFDGIGTGATLTGLASGAAYEVRVRAINDEGASPWSEAGSRRTATATATYSTKPKFDADELTLSVEENAPEGSPVGLPVAAEDLDGDSLTYSVTGAAEFAINAATGQIRVAAGATLNYEETQSYTVTVSVTDGEDNDGRPQDPPGIDDTVRVTIEVTDLDEPPGAPVLTEPSSDKETSLDVTWTAPDMTGKPPITGYEVQYRVEGGTGWTAQAFNGAGSGITLTGLASGAAYQVQVRAVNDEGAGPWSYSGIGATVATNVKPLAGGADTNAEPAPTPTPVATPDIYGRTGAESDAYGRADAGGYADMDTPTQKTAREPALLPTPPDHIEENNDSVDPGPTAPLTSWTPPNTNANERGPPAPT